MSTRGIMGFRLGGTDHGQYVHSDAYPDGLGADVVRGYREAIKLWGLDGLKERVRNLEIFTQDQKATKKQIEKLQKYSQVGVASGRLDDPYCLLHQCQGHLISTIESGAFLENIGFIHESLHCEWAYFINFDDMTFEVYKGFQESEHSKGRFAQGKSSSAGYYSCALVAEYALDDIPEDWIENV